MLINIDKKIGVSKERYKMLFAFDNSYGVFRKTVEEGEDISSNYELIYFADHNCVLPVDVLLDIIFSLRTDSFDLCPNDVVCIRVNGQLNSYRFCGIQSWNADDIFENFLPIEDFLLKEQKDIINRLHKEARVLNILDGSTLSIKDAVLNKYSFYGIEKEMYPSSNKKNRIISEYNIYSLENNAIHKVNPNGNPFFALKNALFFFYKKCNGKNSSVLLFDRKELEMIKDYWDLKQESVYGISR